MTELIEGAIKKALQKIAQEKAIPPLEMDRVSIGIGVIMEKDEKTGQLLKKPELAYCAVVDGAFYRQMELDEVIAL